MKLVVNSAYGYLAAGGSLTRFADVHAANEVTRRGREVLDLMCRALAARGVTLLEADTDGVYFSVPDDWTEADERRVVAEVAALLPPLVQLEFDGRYAAMLSHEPKNYALLGVRRHAGAARRRVPLEPRGAVRRGVPAPRDSAACSSATSPASAMPTSTRSDALRRRELPTRDVSSRVRLTKTPAQYLETRDTRRELSYEAMLASGRTSWSIGERVRVYRTTAAGGVVPELTKTTMVRTARSRSARLRRRSLRPRCCATPSRRGSPARSRPTTSPPCSPTPISCRSSHPSLATIRSVLTPMETVPSRIVRRRQ